uniref:Uncharacterized protein n=1 Tax=Angiostrongylus cantonensis TaxID=6313 RepID=A0A0K0DEP0_ANGCA
MRRVFEQVNDSRPFSYTINTLCLNKTVGRVNTGEEEQDGEEDDDGATMMMMMMMMTMVMMMKMIMMNTLSALIESN